MNRTVLTFLLALSAATLAAAGAAAGQELGAGAGAARAGAEGLRIGAEAVRAGVDGNGADAEGAGAGADPRLAALIEGIAAESLLDHVDALVAFGTRRWDQPGARRAQEWIESFFSGLGLDEVHAHDFGEGSDNVIGILRGATRPERIHVIGAHYDSIVAAQTPEGPAPGADDNASGTAALLEVARAIAGAGIRPEETILFAAFSAEEPGLVGSRAFVADLVADGCLLLGGDAPGCREAADANDDGRLDISDPIRILLALYGGQAPLPPPSCGPGPTGDALGCGAPADCGGP